MPCCSCGGVGGLLCTRCRASVEPASRRRLAGGLVVRPAWVHAGPARTLVHLLKYRGLGAAARALAHPMAELIDAEARVLVPVPRVLARMWRHGVDPARELAVAVGRLTGLPVVGALHRPLWWPRRAGSSGRVRGEPRFRVRRSPLGVVLVDDVVTTGRTLAAAHRCLPGVRYAVTATGAPWERSRAPSV